MNETRNNDTASIVVGDAANSRLAAASEYRQYCDNIECPLPLCLETADPQISFSIVFWTLADYQIKETNFHFCMAGDKLDTTTRFYNGDDVCTCACNACIVCTMILLLYLETRRIAMASKINIKQKLLVWHASLAEKSSSLLLLLLSPSLRTNKFFALSNIFGKIIEGYLE